jgi:hypothetical protein
LHSIVDAPIFPLGANYFTQNILLVVREVKFAPPTIAAFAAEKTKLLAYLTFVFRKLEGFFQGNSFAVNSNNGRNRIMIPEYTFGNRALLDLPRVAFLCSRRCPAFVVTKSYDWAIEKRTTGVRVVSGNHSQVEKGVLHYLLKGSQPIIVALARGLKKRVEPDLSQVLAKNRLLIITPFDSSITRVT